MGSMSGRTAVAEAVDGNAVVVSRSIAQAYDRGLRTMAAATAVGLALGLLLGGIGSRLAMRALFLTSDPSVRGLVSDDGFRIGQFNAAATLSLLVVGTVIGVIGAIVYLAVRPFLVGPGWLRWTTCALGAGAVVGSMIVHDDGVDFTVLAPRWFAIALFAAIPALFGFLAPPAIELATHPDGWFQSASRKVALAPLLALLFPPLLLLVGIPAAAVIGVHHVVHKSPSLDLVVRHPLTMWTVRAGWLAVGVLGAAFLARDAVALL